MCVCVCMRSMHLGTAEGIRTNPGAGPLIWKNKTSPILKPQKKSFSSLGIHITFKAILGFLSFSAL